MSKSFTIHHLPFTTHSPLTIYHSAYSGKRGMVNVWKTVNGKRITEGLEAV